MVITLKMEINVIALDLQQCLAQTQLIFRTTKASVISGNY